MIGLMIFPILIRYLIDTKIIKLSCDSATTRLITLSLMFLAGIWLYQIGINWPGLEITCAIIFYFGIQKRELRRSDGWIIFAPFLSWVVGGFSPSYDGQVIFYSIFALTYVLISKNKLMPSYLFPLVIIGLREVGVPSIGLLPLILLFSFYQFLALATAKEMSGRLLDIIIYICLLGFVDSGSIIVDVYKVAVFLLLILKRETWYSMLILSTVLLLDSKEVHSTSLLLFVPATLTLIMSAIRHIQYIFSMVEKNEEGKLLIAHRDLLLLSVLIFTVSGVPGSLASVFGIVPLQSVLSIVLILLFFCFHLIRSGVSYGKMEGSCGKIDLNIRILFLALPSVSFLIMGLIANEIIYFYYFLLPLLILAFSALAFSYSEKYRYLFERFELYLNVGIPKVEGIEISFKEITRNKKNPAPYSIGLLTVSNSFYTLFVMFCLMAFLFGRFL